MTDRRLSPENLINAYVQGWFPMMNEAGVLEFYGADPRAVFEIDKIVPSKRTRKLLRDERWLVTHNKAFEAVMRACGEREETWISEDMIQAYTTLHQMQAAHSIEVWVHGELVGGLYGVSIGAAFFGESMFNRIDNAAKVAFHHLIMHLRSSNFELLDSQFINAFTQSLGAIEIPASEYLLRLKAALAKKVSFLVQE